MDVTRSFRLDLFQHRNGWRSRFLLLQCKCVTGIVQSKYFLGFPSSCCSRFMTAMITFSGILLLLLAIT